MWSTGVSGLCLQSHLLVLLLLLLVAGDVEKNPGPLSEELLAGVDDTELNEYDTQEVYRAVLDLAGMWRDMCFALGLRPAVADTIVATCENPKQCLRQVIIRWLKKMYDVSKHGPPTWRTLVKAVSDKAGGDNPALAEEIAKKRKEASEKQFMQKLEYLRPQAEVYLRMFNDMRKRLKELPPDGQAAKAYRGVMGDVVKVLYLLNKKPSAVQMPPDGLRLLSWCEQILQRYLRGASQDSKGGPQADCATVSTSSTVAGHGKLDFSTLDEAIRFYCDLGPADSTWDYHHSAAGYQ